MSSISVKPFLDENFILENKTAQKLFFDYAEKMPIIDYHNHLIPSQIASNHQFENITQAWLAGDHYKWRAQRALGINEDFITGSKSDKEKFDQWAYTVPYTMRNPLYHWTHMELQRYFGVDKLLMPLTSDEIYAICNEALTQDSHSVHGLLKMRDARVVCTTDDPTDNLEHHIAYGKQSGTHTKMFPSYRPDKFIMIEHDNFLTSIEKLSSVLGNEINTFEDLINGLEKRAEFFNSLGCRASDHGLQYIDSLDCTYEQANSIFKERMLRNPLNQEQIDLFHSYILIELCKIYHKLGWAQQFHLGALRNNNLKALRTMGPDTGWDSIGDWSQAGSLSRLLGKLVNEDKLTKTILYNLNPADNEVLATMIGNFNDGSMKGKIQFGSGWWFLDQKDGMEKQINALSNMGMLSCFLGMLTDSRSFLSFPRHEYFRRILCNIFGKEIENGELPNDIEWIGKLIQDICYNNVKEYFNF
jgi:glucuronate isomerase